MGCSGEGSGTSPSESPVGAPRSTWSPDELSDALGSAVTTYAFSGTAGVGDSAGLSGALEDRHGCAVVVTEDGQTVIPSFPLGWTEVGPEQGQLSWGRGHVAQLGHNVMATGDYDALASLDLPDACETVDAEWLFRIRPED